MTRDEETLFLRLLQEADVDTLREHLTLKEDLLDGEARVLTFDVVSGMERGYLMIRFDNATQTVEKAEMDVAFPTMLGLNRSPLELRILCEHVLDTWPF